MSYTLFLDDLRNPPWWLGYDPIIARDVAELKLTIHMYGVPSIISFDHDLGKFESGEIKSSAMVGLQWLIDEHLDSRLNLSEVHQVFVHSSNPAGALNIMGLWDSFAAHIDSDVRAVRREAPPSKSLA